MGISLSLFCGVYSLAIRGPCYFYVSLCVFFRDGFHHIHNQWFLVSFCRMGTRFFLAGSYGASHQLTASDSLFGGRRVP